MTRGFIWVFDKIGFLINGEGDMVWLGEAHVMEMVVVCNRETLGRESELGWGFTAFTCLVQ